METALDSFPHKPLSLLVLINMPTVMMDCVVYKWPIEPRSQLQNPCLQVVRQLKPGCRVPFFEVDYGWSVSGPDVGHQAVNKRIYKSPYPVNKVEFCFWQLTSDLFGIRDPRLSGTCKIGWQATIASH